MRDGRHIVVVRRQKTGEIHAAPNPLGRSGKGKKTNPLFTRIRGLYSPSHLALAGKSREFHMEMGKIISARIAGTSNDLSLLDNISFRNGVAFQMGIFDLETKFSMPLGPGPDGHIFIGYERWRLKRVDVFNFCHVATVHGCHNLPSGAEIVNAWMASRMIKMVFLLVTGRGQGIIEDIECLNH